MTFRMGDSRSENYIDIEMTQKEIIDFMGDYAYEKLIKKCDCEIGETKIIPCFCEEYADYFLVDVF